MAEAVRDDRSMAERVVLMSVADRNAWFARQDPDYLERLAWHWPFWCRPSQQPPAGYWSVWLVMAGRGFGKTRMGAEWVRQIGEEQRGKVSIALVASTMAEARAVMVEGSSGILAVAPPDRRPHWEPTRGRLTWAGGVQAFVYSAAEPEGLRGAQHHYAWADEIGKWGRGQDAWTNLTLGMRLGSRPRTVATTTPRAGALMGGLLKRADASDGVLVTRGRTRDNRAHLATSFLEEVTALYGGTRLGRQELDGELIEEVEDALWTRALIEGCRSDGPASVRRVVVGVDPPAGVGGDACGIVAVALDGEGRAHVIEDASVAGLGPEGWAAAVAECAARCKADRVVAEANNGGAMVESVLRAADACLPVKLVHAAHGKWARAEPVAALYAKRRVAHAGAFPALEDELCGLVANGAYQGPGRSPDRADALVWAVTELMLGRRLREPGVRLV